MWKYIFMAKYKRKIWIDKSWVIAINEHIYLWQNIEDIANVDTQKSQKDNV